MSIEDIEIRISKSGEVFVKIHGLTEERLRDYRQFLEEMIGPIHGELRIDRPDWEKPAQLAEDVEAGQRREQQLER
jgi:hypothetical protein